MNGAILGMKKAEIEGKLDEIVAFDVAIVGDNTLQDFIEAATVFEVGDGQVGGRLAQHDGKFSVMMQHRWTLPTKI